MANNKANKISFIGDGRVPLLYMADNKPRVDTTLKTLIFIKMIQHYQL